MKTRKPTLRLESLEDRTVPIATVTNVQFGDGTPQRSMVKSITVNFSENVNIPNVANAFTLNRSAASTSPGTVGNVGLLPTTSASNVPSVVLTFSSYIQPSGSLVDGIYDVFASAAVISSAVDGTALDGDNDGLPGGLFTKLGTLANKQFAYFGDLDGDGTAFLNDFADFRSVFNLPVSPSIPLAATFDVDNSGYVDLPDWVKWHDNFWLYP